MEDWFVRHPLPDGDSYLTLWGVPLVIWGWMVIGGMFLAVWYFKGGIEDHKDDDE